MLPILLLLSAVVSSSLPTVGEDIVEKVIARHEGKVVILNFWATWCAPCREEFPDLVRLYEENREDTVLVSVSMDEPEDVEKVLAYLKEQDSDFPVYLRGFKDFQVFANAVDPDWMGAIPATFVFDKSGERVYGHEGKLTYDELKRIVKQYQ